MNSFLKQSIDDITKQIEKDERLIGVDKWLACSFESHSDPELNQACMIVHVIDRVIVSLKFYSSKTEFERDKQNA